jgi:L-ribulose-5-phosphate 4-epimerase
MMDDLSITRIDQAKMTVVQICRSLLERDILKGTGGNVSVRVEGCDAFAITPSNYDYVRMTTNDVCVLDPDLNVLSGERKPSIESGMHAGVYQHRKDVNVILHTHQVFSSALAVTSTSIPSLFDEQVKFLGRQIEVIPYALSGTDRLHKKLVKKLSNQCNAYLLQNHGSICFGPDPERAIFNVLLLDKCAQAYVLALCTGKKVTTIPKPLREIALDLIRSSKSPQDQNG